ncbi:hypothetical protein GCM10022402_11950 [Salinactinospora qingdaonensis]|uniref:Uncharacterized protein n=1 Tax=Salinactinospora qingdaonensis TaxID=702744 RepID=A0ABP7FAT8_9ACTN
MHVTYALLVLQKARSSVLAWNGKFSLHHPPFSKLPEGRLGTSDMVEPPVAPLEPSNLAVAGAADTRPSRPSLPA